MAAYSIIPTSDLPPLASLRTYNNDRIKDALHSLKALYFPMSASPSKLVYQSVVNSTKSSLRMTTPRGQSTPHIVHDSSIPDSGYVSEEDEEREHEHEDECNVSTTNDGEKLTLLLSDPLERSFTIKWLTGFVKRFDVWIEAVEIVGNDAEAAMDSRIAVVDEATKLLARFSGTDEVEEELTRLFLFPFHSVGERHAAESDVIRVELNDAPLDRQDHTSVGLQSWASAIVLSERICADPSKFLIPSSATGNKQPRIHILELGAGTGLLSIVSAKILQKLHQTTAAVKIVATDYHSGVLINLSRNVHTNFPSSSTFPVELASLDWSGPVPLEGSPFEVILAADVIYHPQHARLIKTCVEGLLRKPSEDGGAGGVFWLIMPLRSIGRHRCMDATVDEVFPDPSLAAGLPETPRGRGGKYYLAATHREDIVRQGGVGRADEGGYKMFEIRWVKR